LLIARGLMPASAKLTGSVVKNSAPVVFVSFVALLFSLPAAATDRSSRTLTAVQVTDPPVIDGKATDSAWSKAASLTTFDPLAKTQLEIRSVYTKSHVYILATFPDRSENRDHKTLVWVPDQKRYRIGPDREDTFVLKWSMEAFPVDLRIDAENSYRADIWYWKSHRTDHAGFADDKMHVYSTIRSPKAKKLLSRNGTRYYLTRPGDSGGSAYRTEIQAQHRGDRTPLFALSAPTGSRADVRAKGTWKDGRWTVEFARKLKTGNSDDIQLDPGRQYAFGVSRFEIAGRRPNPKIQEPLFGSGEITELLTFRFD